MDGKETKKKQLKTLITFHSEEVFRRAQAEANTAALVEALLARHFGITIEGDTVQAQLRRIALEDYEIPFQEVDENPPAEGPLLTEDEDGDLDDGPLVFDPKALALPELPPVSETAPIVPAKVKVEDIIPDRPVDAPVSPHIAAFTPVETHETPNVAQSEEVTSELQVNDNSAGAATAPVEPAPVTPEPTYEVGARICPTCGIDMGTSPYCLNCL